MILKKLIKYLNRNLIKYMIKERIKRIVAFYLAISIFFEIAAPSAAFALTGGPSQPEVQSFTPVGTSDMVNIFTGDMNYNIPLMDVDGYPINIAYDAGISMDQEASWVGLGWNINPGTINRNMRGLPDDFKDDIIHKELNVKPNQSFGIFAGIQLELLGKKLQFGNKKIGGGASAALDFNTYAGWALSISANAKFNSSVGSKAKGTLGIGINMGSGKGVGITANANLSKKVDQELNKAKGAVGLGIGFNSIAGLQSLSVNYQTGHSDKISSNKFLKKIGSNKPSNGGFSFTFANPSYLPFGGNNMLNVSTSFNYAWGFELYGGDAQATLGGSYSGSFIKDPTKDYYAYGYLNSINGNDGSRDNLLHDFNREKDVVYTKDIPNLPLASMTYDNFTYTGQGIGGNFRPQRRDFGTVFDPKVTNAPDVGLNVGIDVGTGQTVKVGVDVQASMVNSHTSKWEDGNQAESLTRFTDGNVYYKQGGEKAAETNIGYFNDVLGGFEPVSFEILGAGAKHYSSKYLIDKYHQQKTISSNYKSGKIRVNEAITVLTANIASITGIEKEIKAHPTSQFDYFFNQSSTTLPTTIPRTIHPGHHISEITTTKPDGTRYVYGIPAYNNKQVECTFALSPGYSNEVGAGLDDGLLKPNISTDNLVPYNHNYGGGDNSIKNGNGLDHFYSYEAIPKYAHSYLLTDVLSADYVDRTGDGPSKDDYGTYTKFNYSRVYDNYNWRTPYDEGRANFDRGLRSRYAEIGDDKGNYVAGNKEIWMLHSIETKNYVACFYVNNNRKDGYGVKGEEGGLNNTQPLYKLDSIKLFSRQELIDNKSNLLKAVALKTVHFEYDYSLCQGVKNNIDGGGKLTLKKVWFTYQGSQKGKLSPYEFSYGNNPNYNSTSVDKWGTYKENNTHFDDQNDEPNNADFPYTKQDDITDIYAASWNLTSIKLPSGGEIKVQYESDDYAFVQNKKAMQMFTLAGASTAGNSSELSLSFDNDGFGNKKRFLYVNLSQKEIEDIQNSSNPENFIRERYFRDENGQDIKYLYFRVLLNVERVQPGRKKKREYVSGYAEIDFTASAPQLIGNKLSFPVKFVPIYDNVDLGTSTTIHPIQMAGINFTRRNLPQVAYDNDQNPFSPNGGDQILALVGIFKSVFTGAVQLFQGGISQALKNANASTEFVPARSYVRLYCPSYAKKGGGYRVKEIRLNDNWKSLSENSNSNDVEYGQEYIYKTRDAYGNVISSGVASYEPLVAGDENPFKEPVFYDIKHILAPDDDYYLEKPFGESFFPGPSVGYSQVIVRNLQHKSSNGTVLNKRHATGAVVHEFYTARDFPTITDHTNLGENKKRHKPNPLAKFLKFNAREFLTAAQGYVVVQNDMHGKPKAQWVYSEVSSDAANKEAWDLYDSKNKNYISGVEYRYKRNGSKLNNYSDVVLKDGKIQNTLVGVDYDMTVDARESETTSNVVNVQINGDGFILGIIPIAIPTVWPTYQREKTRLRTSVVTKVIYQYGLLDETIAYKDGASVATKNILFDAETGEVLLTKTTNTYSDPIYNLTYPAHWVYDRMGQACKNNMMTSKISGGVFTNPSILTVGDELYLEGTSGKIKAWVFAISPNVLIMDINGNYLNLNAFSFAQVVRSGNRNQQNTPVGSVVSMQNPILGGSIILNSNTKVINASASEYQEDWGIFCNCNNVPGTVKNPFITGQKGNFRPLAAYAYLTGREQTKYNNNTNIRKDGPYKTFAPFWISNNQVAPYNWSKTSDVAWQYTTKSTIYSPFGVELENVDALNRYSSAVYGYNNTLPVAVSSNAKYRQIGNENFEDYDYNNLCDNNHFSYQQYSQDGTEYMYGLVNNNNVTNNVKKINSTNQKYSHTGRRSFKVPAGQSPVILTKTITTTCQ